MLIEACVESMEEALKARDNGADRIELCSRLDLDGLTPSVDLVNQVCRNLNIPVMVMIRPRGGDFVYSEEEIRVMEEEIKMAGSAGASGVVFGLLTSGNHVDVDNCARLAALAYPLPVTFHKAVDCMEDPAQGVRELREVNGITRILTSGGKPTAREGASKIREMIREAQGKFTILVAGKVTRENVGEIRELTGATEFHGRKIAGVLT